MRSLTGAVWLMTRDTVVADTPASPGHIFQAWTLPFVDIGCRCIDDRIAVDHRYLPW
ncbi:MAG: hypothetical protein R2856_22430 [Caldilineaceae bacterium]